MQIRPGDNDDFPAISAAGLKIDARIRPEHMVVARDDDGDIAGYAYCFRSQLHHSRYWAGVRVAKHYRRQGLARELLRELGEQRSEPLPFAVKLRSDSNKVKFVEALGGRIYQVVPASRLALTDAATLRWAHELVSAVPDITVVDGTQLTDAQLVDAWRDIYVWTHAPWSPVTSRDDVVRVFGAEVTLDLAREQSFFALSGQRIVAAAFAFQGPRSEPLDVVAETVEPSGDSRALEVCVRSAVLAARELGWRNVTFDCHRDDPHLYPLLRTAPHLEGTPLYSMEYDPAGIPDPGNATAEDPAALM